MRREEKLERLRMTDADRKALAFVPPGPDPPEKLAEMGVEWAQALLRRRAEHSSSAYGHRLDLNGYCGDCEQRYKVAGS